MVWWHQRNGDVDEFRQIAYDIPLAPGTDEVEIPFGDLATPYSENMISFRSCTDRSVCGYSLPALALASVMVSINGDGDGALSFDELRAEQIGGAEVLIGWSPEDQQTGLRGWELPSVMPAGFSIYFRGDSAGVDPNTTSDVAYPISFCPPGDASCAFPISRVLCHVDCDRDWGLNRFGI